MRLSHSGISTTRAFDKWPVTGVGALLSLLVNVPRVLWRLESLKGHLSLVAEGTIRKRRLMTGQVAQTETSAAWEGLHWPCFVQLPGEFNSTLKFSRNTVKTVILVEKEKKILLAALFFFLNFEQEAPKLLSCIGPCKLFSHFYFR